MGGEWKTTTVNEIATRTASGPFGSNIKSSEYVSSGVPVIRGFNLAGPRFLPEDFVYLTKEKARQLSASSAWPDDIVLAARGTIGSVGVVPRGPYDEYILSSNLIKLTVDPQKADPLFVFYSLRSHYGQEEIRSYVSTTGVPKIARALESLRKFRVFAPPLPEQRAIAHILGTLDDKIELNRRMASTLEEMTRALFKAWFVDFEPVRAKMDGRWRRGESLPGMPAHLYDLFPDRLVDSELGPIPEGWEVGRFSDVAENLRERENPLEWPKVVYEHFSIPAFDEGQWPKRELGTAIRSIKSRVPHGVVLLSKLNPEIERVWLVDVHPTDRSVCSTEFLVLQPRSPFGRCFVYSLARSPQFRQQIEALVTGTSKSHQRAQVGPILNIEIAFPPRQVAEAFERTASSNLNQTLLCRRESRTLDTVRDTLLPKLISGELRVKDAERFIAEVNQ